jgi:GABA(A) receptor-associated protein
MQIRPEDAIFLFIGNNIPPSSYNIGNLYHKYKDKDGFLYMQYSKENTFG